MKIKKGFVYVVKDIDINGKCKHGFVPITDVLVDEKTTLNDVLENIKVLEKRNVQLEQAVNKALDKITALINENQKITNDAMAELADVVSKGRF